MGLAKHFRLFTDWSATTRLYRRNRLKKSRLVKIDRTWTCFECTYTKAIKSLIVKNSIFNAQLIEQLGLSDSLANLVCDENDTPVQGSLRIQDITERKVTEEKLRMFSAELQRSNQELEQFAYVASHDLQEPLRAIAGMVQLLQQRYQGKLDERADEYIQLTVEAATRMQKLINDLLAYSRVGRRDNQFERIEIDKVLKSALANLTVAIRESEAVVTHDPLPTLVVDSTQLAQVFQNLIGNGIKFRGDRPPEVHIGALELDDAWRFEVRDNGIGIEPQYYERIFQIFQRLHGRNDYPGTGIGLSLCQKIVENHGGRIWIESEAGQGSRFYFTIPHRR